LFAQRRQRLALPRLASLPREFFGPLCDNMYVVGRADAYAKDAHAGKRQAVYNGSLVVFS